VAVLTGAAGAPVKGQDEVLSGGLVSSLLADTKNPC
jgi:hypothetical protein